MHTTNYFNSFIEIAADCPVQFGEKPPQRGTKKSVANLQYELLFENPYRFTSDDLLFAVFAQRKEIDKSEMEEARNEFFSKGQPCFRASPLTKRYGWGIHSDKDGKVAMVGAESAEYKDFQSDDTLKKYKAMRSKRA